MNIKKFTDAIKKAVENTNRVTQENEGKSYNKPSGTYNANIFTGTKEDWEKQDNELFNSLDEQGYNREDLHTLFDTDQDGVISEEESLYIAGLDGVEEVSNEDIEIYLEELSTIDVNSLGDTEEEIIASAEREIPLLDFDDPNVEEKLFDFLGVEIINGEYILNNDDPMRYTIYKKYIENPETRNIESAIEETNDFITRINNASKYSEDDDFTTIINYYNRHHGIDSNLPEIEDIGSDKLTIYEVTDLEYITAEHEETGESPLKMYKDGEALVTALYAMNALYPSEHTEAIADLSHKFHRTPSWQEGANDLLGRSPIEFYNNIITETANIWDLYDEQGYTPTIVYDESGENITQVIVTDANNNTIIVTINPDNSFSTTIESSSEEEQNVNANENLNSPITSEYNCETLVLCELNQFGEILSEDPENQNSLTSSLTNVKNCEDAYEIIVAYCSGDTETADKMYTALYGETPKTENNIYHQDSSSLIDRMFDVQNGKQVLSPDFLNSFSSSVENEDGTSTLKTYSIVNNELHITEENISMIQSTDGMPLTSVKVSLTKDIHGNIIDEKTVTYNYAYKTENGEQIINDEETTVTIQREGEEDIVENLDDYYKRFAIESFYGINTNMSTEDVNIYYYQVYQNDLMLSNICTDYIAERNSEGIFDDGYNAVKRLLGLGTLPEDVEDEIVQRALMTTALKNLYDGNIEEATGYCEDEFFRRIYNADNFSEIYNYALDFYGNEEYAMQFIEELFKNENIQKSSLPCNYQDENHIYADYSSLEVQETPPGSGNYVLLYNIEIDGGKYTTTVEITDMNIGSIDTNEFDNTVKKAYSNVIDEQTGEVATIPATAEAIYGFYTSGGKVDVNNISEYETSCENWNSYNLQIEQTENVEEFLANAPVEAAINLFLPKEGTIEEGIALFNDYYSGIFGDDTENNVFATYNQETGEIEVQIIFLGGYYTLNLEYNSETKLVEIPDDVTDDYAFSMGESNFLGINNYINNNNLYTVSEFKEYRQNDTSGVNESATQYAKHVLENEELRKEYAKKIGCKAEDLTIEELIKYLHSDEHCLEESKNFMEYVKDDSFNTLYGENRASEILREYSSDMDAYGGRLSQIATYSCIGFSVVSAVFCPAAAPVFMKAALYTGYIDNAIDLGNMLTNNQKDNYTDWTFDLVKEYVIKKGFKIIGNLAGSGADTTTGWLASKLSFVANNPFVQKAVSWIAEAGIETVISIPYLAVINGGKIDLSDEFIQNMIFDGIPHLQAGAFEMNGIKQGEIYDESGVKYKAGPNNERFYFDENNRVYKQVVDGKTIEFDESGRATRVIDGDTTTKYNYKENGTIEAITKDANGNEYIKICDSKGQLIEGTLRDSNRNLISSTTCTYVNGQLTEKITTNEVDKNVLTTTYDANGRPVFEIIKNTEEGTEIHINYEYENGKLLSIEETNKTTGETIKTEFDETGMPERTTVSNYKYKDGYSISELADSDGTILITYQTETGKMFEVTPENALKLQDASKETIEQLADIQARGWDVDTLMSATGDYTSFRIDENNILYIGDKAYVLPENVTPSMTSKCIADANGDVAKGFEIASDYKSMLESMDIAKQDAGTETCAMSASLSAMVSDSGWGQALLNNITYNSDSGKYAIEIDGKTYEFEYKNGDNVVEAIYKAYTDDYSTKTIASDFMQAIFPDSSKLLLSSSTLENIAQVKNVINEGTGIVTFNVGKDITAITTQGKEIQIHGEHAYVVSKINDDGSVVLKDTQDNEITVSKEEFERISSEGDGQFAGRIAGKNADLTDGVTTERAVGSENILKENNQNKLIEKGITPKFATEISNELNIEIKEIKGGPGGGQIILNDGTMLAYSIRKQENGDVILSFNNKKFTYNSENVLQSVCYESGKIKITEHYVDGIYNGKTEFCPTKSYYEYTTFDNNGNKIKFECKTKQDQLIYDETYEILPNGQRTTYTNYESGVKIESEKYSDGTSKQRIEVNITPEMQKGITHHVGVNNSVNGGFLYGGHYLSGYEKLFDMDTIELTLYTKNKNGRGVVIAGTTTATIQKSADGNEITIKYTDENGNAVTLKIERGLQNADGTYTYMQTKIDENNNIIETRPKTVVNQEQYENMYRELQDMPPERFYSVDNIKDPSMKEIYFYTNTENGRIYWRYITNGTTLYPINETEIPKDVLNYFKNN